MNVTYTADLHVHSSFAYSTSKALDLDELTLWARLKGVDLLATGDFTHPEWLAEISGRLTELGDGLFGYGGVKFVLGAEVNSNSRQNGRSRRIHLLLFAPSLAAVGRINAALARHGRLDADGRPTINLSPRDIAHLLHGIDDRCFIIAAHLWTPWFGAYGAKSGFDSLSECFGDAVGLVPAVETGLSSDPGMAWNVPSLDEVAIVSFSDLHSGPKLAREATVFPGEPSYDGLLDSLRHQRIEYTVEFHPAEGKYHHTGHRKCGYDVPSTDEPRPRCPKCGRPLTVGVLQRVRELSTRDLRTWTGEDGLTHGEAGRPPFRHLVGLSQIVAEAVGVGPNSKRVRGLYLKIAEELGGELAVLLETPLPDIARVATERVAEGVGRARAGELSITPGYDGLYGTVRIWPQKPSGTCPREQAESPRLL